MKQITIALAGNPNVGKSTVFNCLTGLKQHTGNWPGKTVTNAHGHFTYKDTRFLLVDLPGTYSLSPTSVDEAVARDFICSGEPDITLIVVDGTCLERNLNLVLQVLKVTEHAILCVNLLDEARKKQIEVDLDRLSVLLDIPVVGMAARAQEGKTQLLETLYHYKMRPAKKEMPSAKEIYAYCVRKRTAEPHHFDRKLDQVITSRRFGFPIMLALLALIFWITIVGANYPSQWLSAGFSNLETKLQALDLPSFIEGPLIEGVYKTLTWVIAVMLPPMAIFFPLFTLLEDFGYLPRVAFNLDHAFKKCCAHGKQALTMCMGFGCNACGVIGCRIIASERERLLAILTNSMVPCNGRFPVLISISTMFFAAAFSFGGGLAAGLILSCMVLLGILMTLLTSKVLSKTMLKGMPSSFILELPPYRMPQFGSVILRSLLDRTAFVLGRAIAVAAPAGLLIWALANVHWNDATLLAHCTQFCEPFGQLIGIDGVIVIAFILGFPANEIVLPIIFMSYMANGTLAEYGSLSQLHEVLIQNGWTWQTALSVMCLCLFHFPCGTTCMTIKKETGSWKWTAFAFFLPTAIGVSCCFILNITVTVLC